MTLVDNPIHRHNALVRLKNIRLIVTDLQTEVSIAVQQQPAAGNPPAAGGGRRSS